jgi:hypothetical protein
MPKVLRRMINFLKKMSNARKRMPKALHRMRKAFNTMSGAFNTMPKARSGMPKALNRVRKTSGGMRKVLNSLTVAHDNLGAITRIEREMTQKEMDESGSDHSFSYPCHLRDLRLGFSVQRVRRQNPVDRLKYRLGGDAEDASRLSVDRAFVAGAWLAGKFLINDRIWSVGPRAPVVAV